MRRRRPCYCSHSRRKCFHMGHGEMTNCLLPNEVKGLQGFVVTCVSAGWNHSGLLQIMASFSLMEMACLASLVMVIMNENAFLWRSCILILSMSSKLLVVCATL